MYRNKYNWNKQNLILKHQMNKIRIINKLNKKKLIKKKKRI